MNREQRIELIKLFHKQEEEDRVNIHIAALESSKPIEDMVFEALYEHFLADKSKPIFLPTFVPNKVKKEAKS